MLDLGVWNYTNPSPCFQIHCGLPSCCPLVLPSCSQAFPSASLEWPDTCYIGYSSIAHGMIDSLTQLQQWHQYIHISVKVQFYITKGWFIIFISSSEMLGILMIKRKSRVELWLKASWKWRILFPFLLYSLVLYVMCDLWGPASLHLWGL